MNLTACDSSSSSCSLMSAQSNNIQSQTGRGGFKNFCQMNNKKKANFKLFHDIEAKQHLSCELK